MKKTITTILAILFLTPVFGQGIDDAFQFSQTYYQGTGKALGMGNALGAVGGDMTSVSINPAGMGIYRSSELTMTLGLVDNYHSSNYYDNQTHANKMRVSIPNLGYIWTKQRSNFRPLRYTQFGIVFNRLNDYNSHTFAKGINPNSSLIDSYLGKIDGYSENDIQDAFPYDIYPAWSTYLIDIYQDEQGDYYSSPVPQGGIWQSLKNKFKGRSEEWTLAWSANFSDKLFFGASLGIQHIKRTGTRVFSESMPEHSDISTDFNKWSFTEELSSISWGVNGKFGLIWHTNHWLRFGAAFHTPSIYGFDESWQTETESQINWITRKYISPESHYEYLFVQPLKWIGSMAFVVGQSGIISMDAEYTNYSAARFITAFDDDFDYTLKNDEIKASFSRTLNFRLGSEWRLQNSYLRLGAGYYGSPLGFGKSNGSVKKASAGISIPAGSSTTFDFAYELTLGERNFTLYNPEPIEIQPVAQSQVKNLFMVSMRIRL